MIDFLDELGNFKQKNFTLQNVKFYILKCQGRTTQPKCTYTLQEMGQETSFPTFGGQSLISLKAV